MTDRASRPSSLTAYSPLLFLVAGGLLAVFAANTAARTFADGGLQAIHSAVGPTGFAVGLLGLVGLYPALADEHRLVARLVGLVAAVPFVGWVVISGFGIGNTLGVAPDASVVLPGPAFILVFLLTMLAYILFSVATLRTAAQARTIGIALLGPAIPFLTLILVVQAFPPVEWGEFVIDSGHALAHFAVGLVLRRRTATADYSEPTPDATS